MHIMKFLKQSKGFSLLVVESSHILCSLAVKSIMNTNGMKPDRKIRVNLYRLCPREKPVLIPIGCVLVKKS